MKRAILLLLVLAGAAFAAYSLQWSPAARARDACNRLEDLCGSSADRCEDDMSSATPEEIAELERCIAPADSCMETVGCMAGSAMRELGQGAMRGLMR